VPAWWLNLLALLVILLTIVPVWRWARLHIHQVVYAQDAADVEVIGQINASLDGARWQPSVLTTIAEPIARPLAAIVSGRRNSSANPWLRLCNLGRAIPKMVL